MTMPALSRVVEYLGDGSTVTFAVPYKFFGNTEIEVVLRDAAGVETEQVLGAAYTVAGGGGAAGSVTFTPAPAVGLTVVIRGSTAISQQSAYPDGGKFPSRTVEGDFDRGTAVDQELNDKITDTQARTPMVRPGQIAPDFASLAGLDGELLQVQGNQIQPVVKAPFAGKLYGGSATGAPVPISVRDVGGVDVLASLADPDAGAQLVSYGDRTVADKLDDVISPLDFGAVCDGVTDDSDAIQTAFDVAMQAGKSISLRAKAGGWWRIAKGIVGSFDSAPDNPDAHSWAMPTLVDGEGCLIEATADYDVSSGPMFTFVNATNSAIRDLRIDGHNVATRALDTSWDQAAAPSRNNRYTNVEIRNLAGANSTIWLADADNDSHFDNVLIVGQIGLLQHISLDAAGGHVRFHAPTIYDCYIEYSCQSLTVHDGITQGFKAFGADDNVTIFSGNGYHYPANDGINIEVKSGARLTALSASGRFENSHAAGLILGGSGVLCGGADFVGAYIFRATGAATITLVGADLGSIAGGYYQIVRIRGGSIQNVGYSGNANVLVSLENVFSAGVTLSAIIEGAQYCTLREGDRMRWRSPAYGLFGGGAQGGTGGVAAGVGATFDGSRFPMCGLLQVTPTNGSLPSALFYYRKGSDYTVRLANSPELGAEITATLSGNTFTISHDATGQTTAFLLEVK